ncbi:hypothetical protein B0A48_10948 [Cryoendolithus antarcticus]|uniref:Rhodopsin domain-containing protein n=1 Tax=Cryoendolithus antarcticus TaxID=1507870 RepID=A0A1V8SYU7_9PEZI|nr:hypothetical protein B0A48_10948 [Cryoendolithus antarcticus]
MAVGTDASPIAVLAVTLVFIILATIATILRLYTRLVIARNAGLDDVFIALALAFALATESMVALEAVYDNGRAKAPLTPAQGLSYAKTVYVSIIMYNVALFCIKMSLILQYLRIFPQKGFRMACYAMMVIVFIYSSWCIWGQVFFCTPIAGFWDYQLARSAKCFPKLPVWFTNAGINIVTDIAIVGLPIPMIRQLKMAKRQKIALMGVFALGFFTCLTSILRLQSLYSAAQLQGGLNQHGAMAALWSQVELATGIICSCLPTLRTLIARTIPNLLGSSAHRTNPSSGNVHYYGTNSLKGAQLQRSGRGLSGREEPQQKSYARRESHGEDSIDLEELASSPKNIRVVTRVEQEVERHRDDGARSDQGSTRDLIRRSSFAD